MITLVSLLIGVILDLIFGDPKGCPHIVVGMGKLIALFERAARAVFPKTKGGELCGGILLVIVMCILSFALPCALLYGCFLLHPAAAAGVGGLICWQCLALRSLKRESMAVYKKLDCDDLAGARAAVSLIVGRDTQELDAAGVTRAAVETVAENTSDGVIAPLIYLAVGVPFGVLYKAINTMDSMLGYKNESYLYFGRAAARLDDIANLLPSRIAALLMIATAWCAGLSSSGAWKIFWRDRYNHKSPNSAMTEAACAGALKVQLGDDAYYFGKLVQKPTIGDGLRPIERGDIRRANTLCLLASGCCLLLIILVRGAFILWL